MSSWMAARRELGAEAWRAKRLPSGPVKLTSAPLGLLPAVLAHGAEADGFRGHVWTCACVAGVLGAEFGVADHKAQVSRLFKALNWTPPMPIERAAQRHEAVLEPWQIQGWPELQKGS